MTFISKTIIDKNEMEFRSILGAFLKFQRENDNISLNYVADSLSMNKGYLSEVENGRRSLSEKHYNTVMDFYDISFDFDKTILEKLRLELVKAYELFIDLNPLEYDVIHKLILNKEKYENSYGFFVFQLILLFYNVRFARNEKEIIFLEPLIKKYLYIYSDEENVMYYDLLSQYYICKNEFSKAYNYISIAVNTCPNSTRTTGLYAITLYHLITILQCMNKSAQTLELCKKTIYEFRREHIYNRLYYVDIYEGNCLSRMHLYEDAERIYLSVLEHTKSLENRLLTKTAYHNLSWNCLKKGSYLDCIKYSKKLIEIGEETDETLSYIPYCLYRLDKKKECLENIYDICNRIENDYYLLFINIIKYRITGKDDKFIDSCNSFLKLCKQREEYETEILIRSLQIEYYKEKRNYKEVSKVQDRVISILYGNDNTEEK